MFIRLKITFWLSILDDTKCQKFFLELLLQGPQENFTDEEIQREVDLLLFAVNITFLNFCKEKFRLY